MKKMYYYIYYIPNKNMPYLTHPLKKLQVLWSLWVKQNQMKKILKLYNIYLLSNADKGVPSDLTLVTYCYTNRQECKTILKRMFSKGFLTQLNYYFFKVDL